MTAPSSGLAAPLVRRRDDRVFRGVCASVARATGTDPVLWRVALFVVTVFGGTGVLLYLLGWALIPEEGSPEPPLAAWVRRRGLSRDALVVVVVGLSLVVTLAAGDDRGALPVLVLGLLAYVVLRRQAAPGRMTGSVTGAPNLPVASPYAPVESPYGPIAWAPPPPAPPRPPRPPVALLTLSAALLVTGVLVGLHAAGVPGLTLETLLAVDLLVVGAGLVVGARSRAGRALLPVALLLGVLLAVTATTTHSVDLSLGQRTWVVTGSGTERLGVGQADLDLRPLRGTDSTSRVVAQVGAGYLAVLVPDGLHVVVRADVRTGTVVLPGEAEPGDHRDVHVVRSYGPADAPAVTVDASVGAGTVQVRRAD